MARQRLLTFVSPLVALVLFFPAVSPAAAASETVSAAGAAGTSSASAGSTDDSLRSCWVSIDSGASLCVDEGDDLEAAVAEVGIDLDFGEATTGRAAEAEVVLSTLYDDTGYDGSSFIMSVSGGDCSASAYGFTSLSSYGWNNRAESFRSYNGCVTAVFTGTSYSGTQYGYYSSSSNLGTAMNNQASSWRVQ